MLPVGSPNVKYRSGPGLNLLMRLRMYFAAQVATSAEEFCRISFIVGMDEKMDRRIEDHKKRCGRNGELYSAMRMD